MPKLEDPGSFDVPCSIAGVKFTDLVCDTGASINIMSNDVAMRLGINDIKRSSIEITFAEASLKKSMGVIENLRVQVDDCLLPCDFHVV